VEAVGRNSFLDMTSKGWRSYQTRARQGQAFRRCWLEMQEEAGIPADGAPDADLPTLVLHLPATEAWPTQRRGEENTVSYNLQKDLTEDRETRRYDALKTQIAALHPDDRAAHLFRNLDRNSAAWVAALPGGYGFCTTGEWVEITARYFGVPSPICAGLAARGARLFGARIAIDKHGDNLVAATGAGVTGGHIAKLWHDPLLALIAELARAMGAHARTEAGDIFGSVLAANPAAYRAYYGGVGRRPGPKVDLYAEYDHRGGRAIPRLFELKTISMCGTRYRQTDGGYRGGAVGRRADALPKERIKEIIKIDHDFFQTPAGQVGPMEARALTFCDASGASFAALVVGAFGEWSEGLATLVTDLADMGARELQGRMGAPSQRQARNTLVWKMRQEIGMCVLRGHAKVIIERARMERVGNWGPAHNGAYTTGADDADDSDDAWADGAYQHRQETRSRADA
jgi:hypothetical protein